MERFALVEKKNHDAIHGRFYTLERAKAFLEHTVPLYVSRGFYMDKTLKPDDFEIIEKPR